jgi:uncharacterized phage-like protein YoqJ
MVTGHRPNKLGGYDPNNEIRTYTTAEMKRILLTTQQTYPEIVGISGMAIGIDQDFANLCVSLDIPFIAYVPFEGQECKWPPQGQKEYRELIEKAQEVKVISTGHYSPRKMQKRNEAMADDSDFAIAVWNGDLRGGTYNCVRYLQRIQRTTFRVNPNNR